MSSPNLNNSVLLGCFLSYLSVFFFGLDGAFISSGYEVICAVSGNHSLISGIILVISTQRCFKVVRNSIKKLKHLNSEWLSSSSTFFLLQRFLWNLFGILLYQHKLITQISVKNISEIMRKTLFSLKSRMTYNSSKKFCSHRLEKKKTEGSS